MSEKNIQSQCWLEASKQGVTLFRNNVGVAIAITPPKKKSWTALMKAVVGFVRQMGGFASPIKYGLHEGSGDLVGWKTIVITTEMVGQKIAQFVSLEVKTATGTAEPDQITWLNNVRRAGGLAGVVRSPDEAVAVCNPLLGVE